MTVRRRSTKYLIGMAAVLMAACKNEPDPKPACSGTISFTTSVEADTCGSGSGSITFEDLGENYEYSIDSGATFQSSETFPNLNAGEYPLAVKTPDCVSYDMASVPSETGDLAFTMTTTDAGCGTANGSITVHATGSTSYTYSFEGQEPVQDSVFTNLAQGTYFIKVTDANGCEAFDNVTVNAGDVSYANDVDPIMMSTCATTDCHDGTNNRADLTNYQGVSSWASGIKTRLLNGSMPKTGTISEEDKETVICWIDDGAPNN